MTFRSPHPSGVAAWRRIYALLVVLDIGDVITYEALEAVVPNFRRTRTAYQRALKELENVNHRSLRNVRGEGYVVIHPDEHIGEVVNYGRRADTAVHTGRRKAKSADRNLLNHEIGRRLDSMDNQLAGIQLTLHRIARDEAARVEAERIAGRQRTDIRPGH